MDKREYLINLYDEYRGLLTEKQRMYFESYYLNDLSLNEIALNNNVSKSLVGKSISIVEEKLESYEKLLNLNKKTILLKSIIKTIEDKKLKEKLESLIY